ncbi:uncharacterized protein LOC122341358 [Puntigrus tetrazona]|uniref:uncharacterized protein LOC122341358 n=1 Tax=Puntigrus tetrazona TaxID=1606681 RepID=UPI001C89453C|nr:uncharacterized protein LOC122341358 [Puntigrus tetrazona]
MGVGTQMDPLDFLTNEELLPFFHRKKTEISCLEEPHRLLTQLRDHDLVPEKLYESVKKMRSRKQKEKGFYEVLDWVEKNRSEYIHRFWRCVFEDHILQLYPTLRILRNSLQDGTFKLYEKPPDIETAEECERKAEKGKEKSYKRRRSKDDRSSENSDDPGPSSASTPKRKKPDKKPSFSSPVKKGDKQEIWTWPIYKTQLPVTCGDKEGTLYREKLPRGEECILSQGLWFTPNDFEKFAGKEKCKNWKVSIRCRNTPLKKLIEEEHLRCPPMERRTRTCVQTNTNGRFPVSSSESSGADTSSGSREESDDDDFQEQGGRRGGTELRERVEEEDMSDLSVFQAPSLPVTCASLTGTLYKNRFASGYRGKCIRTEERWFTPEEFVKQEPTLTDGHWKKDILCHGKTLNFLLQKDILCIHSLLCVCVKCSIRKEDMMAQNNDDECYVCRSMGDLVCCDECPRAFHSDCHLPAVPEDSSGEWICTFCVFRNSQQWRDSSNVSEQEAFDAPISQHILHCHYLLLCVYRQDIQKVFVEDPRPTVPRYSEFITQPMWLDRIKQKLESGEYRTIEAFVSDFRLIFSNCSKFNKDNDFGRMGASLKQIFEEEFRKIFSIQINGCGRMDDESFPDSKKDGRSSSESDWIEETEKIKGTQGVKRKKNQQNGNKKKIARCRNSRLSVADLTDVFQEARNKDQMAVHCGKMAGCLYRIKYDNGEECISCKEKWFTPAQFEKFAGKGHYKKWKDSIYYKSSHGLQVRLQKLIQSGSLSEFGQHKESVREGTQTESSTGLFSKTLTTPGIEKEINLPDNSSDESVSVRLKMVTQTESRKRLFSRSLKKTVCGIEGETIELDSSSDESVSVAERVKKNRRESVISAQEYIVIVEDTDSSSDESVSVAERVKMNRRESVILARPVHKNITEPAKFPASTRDSPALPTVASETAESRPLRESTREAQKIQFSKSLKIPVCRIEEEAFQLNKSGSVAERVKMARNRRESVIIAEPVEPVESTASARDSPSPSTDATEPAVSSVVEDADQITDEEADEAAAAQLDFNDSPADATEPVVSSFVEEPDQTPDEAAAHQLNFSESPTDVKEPAVSSVVEEASKTTNKPAEAQLNVSDSPVDATEPAVSSVVEEANQITDEAGEAAAAQLDFNDSPADATEPAVSSLVEEPDQTTDEAAAHQLNFSESPTDVKEPAVSSVVEEANTKTNKPAAAQLNFNDSPVDATEPAVSSVVEDADQITDEEADEAAAAQLNFNDSPVDATEPAVSSLVEEPDQTTDEPAASQLNFNDSPADATEPAVSSVVEEANQTTDEAATDQLNFSDSPAEATGPVVSPIEEPDWIADEAAGEAAAPQMNFSGSSAEWQDPVVSEGTERTDQMQLFTFLGNQFNTIHETLKSIDLSLKKLMEKQSQDTLPQYRYLIPDFIGNSQIHSLVKKEPVIEESIL